MPKNSNENKYVVWGSKCKKKIISRPNCIIFFVSGGFSGFFGMGNTMRAISKCKNAYMTPIQGRVSCIEEKISRFRKFLIFLIKKDLLTRRHRKWTRSKLNLFSEINVWASF